jgi:hypothetical protein
MAGVGPIAGEIEKWIRDAFAETPYPGDHALVRSAGDEPAEVEALFRGCDDWRMLTPSFVDRAGAASPSALSFFSAEAFRFYLPAYLLADLAGQLAYTDPLFYLYFGLDDATRTQLASVPGQAPRTWWEVQQAHFAGFTPKEASAIVAYLRWKLESGALAAFEERSVAEALQHYWLARAAEGAA